MGKLTDLIANKIKKSSESVKDRVIVNFKREIQSTVGWNLSQRKELEDQGDLLLFEEPKSGNYFSTSVYSAVSIDADSPSISYFGKNSRNIIISFGNKDLLSSLCPAWPYYEFGTLVANNIFPSLAGSLRSNGLNKREKEGNTDWFFLSSSQLDRLTVRRWSGDRGRFGKGVTVGPHFLSYFYGKGNSHPKEMNLFDLQKIQNIHPVRMYRGTLSLFRRNRNLGK